MSKAIDLVSVMLESSQLLAKLELQRSVHYHDSLRSSFLLVNNADEKARDCPLLAMVYCDYCTTDTVRSVHFRHDQKHPEALDAFL